MKNISVIFNGKEYKRVSSSKKDFCTMCDGKGKLCDYVRCQVFDKLFNWKKCIDRKRHYK